MISIKPEQIIIGQRVTVWTGYHGGTVYIDGIIDSVALSGSRIIVKDNNGNLIETLKFLRLKA